MSALYLPVAQNLVFRGAVGRYNGNWISPTSHKRQEHSLSDRSKTVFRVGEWLVEAELNRISRSGESCQLEPKSMDVLVYLCRHADDVVSADDIIDSVWSGRPMGDNPVYKSIAKLRRALGDDANEPRYIATVAKKGYRLLAKVDRVPRDEAPVTARSETAHVFRRMLPIGVGVLIGVFVAAAIFWQPQPDPLRLKSISGFRGSHSQPSFAPGGESIAFVNDIDGTASVWVLDIDETVPRQLTHGASRDSRPRWSPDGRTILFMRRGSLWSIPVGGGEATEIIRDAYNPNWSRDGTRIVFERRYEVWTASADGAEQARIDGIARKEIPLAPRWPAFSPDGEAIIYLDADSTPFTDLWRVPSAGGAPEQLTFEPRIASAPIWTPDGDHIIYSSQRGGSRTLWEVSVEDGTSRPLLTGSGDDDFPEISADGTQLVYSNRRERFAIVRSDPGTGEEQSLHESRQLVLGPELSPDRTKIAFFAMTLDGRVQLFTMPLSGGSPTQITFDPLATHAIPRWSSDGQQLYFYFARENTAFSAVDSGGGEPQVIAPGWDWGVTNGASVSPDGKRIVYSRLTGQTPVQTLIRHLDSNEDRGFHATLEYPRWSKDGSNIIGALHVDQRFPGDIAICPVAGSKCRTIASGARIPMWSPDESEIYFVRGFGTSQEIFVAPVESGNAETKLMNMAPLFPLGPFFDVAPDGDIVWVRYDQEPSEIWLTELADR